MVVEFFLYRFLGEIMILSVLQMIINIHFLGIFKNSGFNLNQL